MKRFRARDADYNTAYLLGRAATEEVRAIAH